MTLPVVFTANGPSGYNLTKSLRFRSSASAYLNRTPATTGNRRTWTWSGWVKRGKLGAFSDLYTANDGSGGSDLDSFEFNSSDVIRIYFQGATSAFLVTSQVFRDPSAWYHIVLAVDTTQATSSNRIKLYVNGVQVTAFSTATYPSQNYDTYFNLSGRSTVIGASAQTSPSGFFDGYMAEVNFVDGQQLTPSSFGSTNALTGVWQPAKYTGSYGTNGFYLKFTDTTSTSTLGTDFSGNSNTWTVNNISLTAGSTYDSMTDVPTLTSATTANYCVLNGLNVGVDCTVSQANLSVAYGSATSRSPMQGTIGMTTGKWYFEAICTASSVSPTSNLFVGIANKTMPSELGNFTGANASGWGFNSNGGTIYNNNVSTAYGSSASVNDIVGVAFDADTGKLYFSVNGTFQNSGNPVTGTNPAFTVSADTYFPSIGDGSGASTLSASINFGQRPFTYTPPTGFVALNTFNLPTSTIVKGNTVMDATLYTGTLLSNAVTNTAGFKPDLVWVKSRSAATDNKLTDSVRGTTKGLISNTTGAETTDTQGLTAFGTGGFTVGTNTDYNNLAATYVGWQWQAGQGSSSSNTSGSITSTVSVNASAGFSVVTYTGTGVNATVGHGLGVAPSMVIVKTRSLSSNNWQVYHSALGQNKILQLDLTNSVDTITNYWYNGTTSTVFGVNGSYSGINSNGATYVAYCWSEIAGFSKFGSYTGNGSTDGPFVYTGFRPKFIMFRITSSTGNWDMLDTSRNTYNVANARLLAESSGAEITGAGVDIVSNGFKIRNTDTSYNGSGQTYIYMAFAENPFKNALAR
jgi:hypothetical protein